MSHPTLSILMVLLIIVCLQTSLNPTTAVANPLADLLNNCQHSAKLQDKRSQELKEIYDADQADRKFTEDHPEKPWSKIKVLRMNLRDNHRRKRVAEIFAEGCFKTAGDYANAAMVFQHGDQDFPDHSYQTFIWAKRAVDLGDATQKHMMALGLDRYLVNSGQKQLFGSQARKINLDDPCWCLQPIEESFPDSMRVEYSGRSKVEVLNWLKQMNGNNNCPVPECKIDLKPTPKGSVPGFW
jgi:hypothetical protein